MMGHMMDVYNGKSFNQVDTKPEMIGHYLGYFSITYRSGKHSHHRGHPLLRFITPK